MLQKQTYLERVNLVKITLMKTPSYKNPRAIWTVLHFSYFKYIILLFSFYGVLHGQSNPNLLNVVATGTNVTYQWYSNLINTIENATLITAATNESYTPPETAGTLYYFVVVHGDCGPDLTSTIVSVVNSVNRTWNGLESTDWNTATNWTPIGIPTEIDNVHIPTNVNYPVNGSLTISCGGSVTLDAGSKLTINGIIQNNGTLTIENGATLVQNGIENNTGLGTYQVNQSITGTGAASPNGRFWYLGSPMANSVSQDYKAETSAVLKYFNEPTGAWVEINNATTPIEVGKGYFVQTGMIDTIEFLGGQLNNGNYTIPCTRTGTTNFYRGFNLVSNPYASYVDFDLVTKTNILPTMWYRTADQTQAMVFDTYNSLTGIGTSIGGEEVTKFIPPMQSFWVKIPAGFTSGEIGFANEMRSHYSIGFEGLKNTTNEFPVFIRLNLLDEGKKDQLIVFMDNHLNSLVDEFDSEKMTIVGYPQLYTAIGGTKLVIDALPFSKLKTSVPLTVNLPSSKTYQIQLDEVRIENATLVLEDKQENIFQDLLINPTYVFNSVNGMNTDRFVLHIQSLFTTTESMGSAFLTENESGQFEPLILSSGLNGGIRILFNQPLETACHVRIYDMSGKLVVDTMLVESDSIINLNESNGIYFVELETKQNVFRKKIIMTN